MDYREGQSGRNVRPLRRASIRQVPGTGRSPTLFTQAEPHVASLAERIQRLEIRAIWEFFTRQPASFWLICLYLFFEYVRPQAIYRSLDLLPWAEWTIWACALATLLEGKIFRRWGTTDLLLLGFTIIVILSSVFAVYPQASFGALNIYISWVLIYFLISRAVNDEWQVFVFFGLFLLFSLKMSQHATRSWIDAGFRFRSWGAAGAPGWFSNSGEMAIQMAIFLPLSTYFLVAIKPKLVGLERKWKYWALACVPATAIFALLASSSRGGQLGGAAVMLWMLLKSRYRLRGVAVAALVGGAVWLLLPPEQKTRFTEIGDDQSSQARLQYWEDGIEIARDYPILGIGYNNWLSYYSQNYQPYSGLLEKPHNIFVEAGAELGYVGLAGFLVLIGATFWMNARTRQLAKRMPHGRFIYYMGHGLDAALIGFLVSGFFVTVLYYPYFWINFAMTTALYKTAREKGLGLAGVRSRTSRYAATRRRPVVARAR